MLSLGPDIGIDLGTASVIVFVKGEGIALHEPSVVALDTKTQEIIAVGEEARNMLGRTPGNIIAMRPMREGVIADYDITERMMRYFIQKACGRGFFIKPRIMVCIPPGVTGVEERAVLQAAIQAGARKAFLIEEPLAAALGAGLDISEPSGSMVVDIGGGTTNAAVMSLGGIVNSRTIRVGGDKLDQSIVRYIRKKFNLMVGERSGEEIKITIGTAFPEALIEPLEMQIRGRDLISGLPRGIDITSTHINEAILEPLDAILTAVKETLEQTPPELAADIVNKGIFLTGGGALLSGLDLLISKHTGLPVYVAEDAVSCVALGTGKALGSIGYLTNAQYKNDKRFQLNIFNKKKI